MKRGFTILELIAVLAVLAALLGLMVPALRGVRTSARGAACMSHLRQMGAAARTYALEHHQYPTAIVYVQRDGQLVNDAWDWVTTLDGRVLGPGRLWAYDGTVSTHEGGVHQCPEYGGGTNFADPHTGYNYNTSFVGGEGRFSQPGWEHVRPGLRPSQARHAGRVALFGDGGVVVGVANKFMRSPLNTEGFGLMTSYSGAQAFRHQRATNVAWLDGHVSAVGTPHRGKHADDALLQHMGYPDSGFLSGDDAAYDPR